MLKYAQTKGLSAESIKVWKAHQDIIWDVFTVFFWYVLPAFSVLSIGTGVHLITVSEFIDTIG